MLIFTRRWGPVAIKYPTVPIGILARCSRASRKSAPRTLWIALVRAPRQFVPRQDEKLLRLVPLLSTVRVQRSLPFFQFLSRRSFFFHSVHSLARDDEEGSNRCRSKNWPNFEGGGWIFFVHFSLFVFQIRPISLPRMRLFTDILFWFRRGGDRGCACGIEFSENLRPGRVEEGCQGRGGRMNLAKAGDRFSGELVVRRRSCRWSS